MKTVYLSGPMSGLPDQNRPAFRAAATVLRHAGYDVRSPVDMDAEDGVIPDAAEKHAHVYRRLLLRDLGIIAGRFGSPTVSKVFVLPGWMDSPGAVAEVALAQALGVPVVCYRSRRSVYVRAAPQRDGALTPDKLAAARPPALQRWTWGDTEGASETRAIDPSTGAAKGTKPARYDLLPYEALDVLATHYAKGAEKYDDYQWRGGYRWSLAFAALQRHASAFWQGEDRDPETGSPHLAAVAFHALALLTFAVRDTGTDDRPRRQENAA